MSSRKKISTAEIERRLIEDVDNVGAWEAPIKVPASNSPRPEGYGRGNLVLLDADVARLFTDSESVNQALRALAGSTSQKRRLRSSLVQETSRM